MQPGTALDETELARRFAVSRTPVREAIRLLAASGLVETPAHRAAVVARPTPQRLAGMFEVMAELEALCAALAAERMTGTDRHELEAAHEELRALIHSGDPQRYHEINEAFHGVVYAGAHNEHLAELTLATRVRVSPYRRAQFRNLGRLAKSHVEHDRVVVAILRGDRDGAAAAMRAHIVTVSVWSTRGACNSPPLVTAPIKSGVNSQGPSSLQSAGCPLARMSGRGISPVARSSPRDFPTARSGRARRQSTSNWSPDAMRSAPNRSTKMRWIAGMNDEPPVRNTWSIPAAVMPALRERFVDRFGDALDVRPDPGFEFGAP